jgi:hypothetical protein
MFCHDTLFNFYEVNFSLVQHHKYSLTEIEEMLPYERKIYIQLLINYIKEQNDKNNT